jgi:anti-sigma regulatory factor (Ser/Thr protein kinase)
MITTTAPLYSCVFHGVPDQVRQARAGVREYLNVCLVPDDTIDNAVLIVSEFASNAVRHSASKGAFFIVRCEVFPGHLWVEIEDLGGPWHPRPPDPERPHGLTIVEALTGPDDWGVETISNGGRVTWARVGIR